MADPVTQYAEAVLAGEIVAGRLVRFACQRHIADLTDAKQKSLVWHPELAQAAIDFFPDSLILDNEKPFVLAPPQQFVVGSLFGWLDTLGNRRYRVAYIEMGKGSGKSPMVAGIGLYGLAIEGPQAAEIYSAAVSREQAKIVFSDATRMAETSPVLAETIDCKVTGLSVEETYSSFKPVSSEHRGLDGKRVYMALIDEIHEHPSGMVVDKMRAGTKGQENALIIEITNSGYDRHSVCWQHHDLSTRILTGAIQNDAWFAYVCTLDSCAACYAAGFAQPKDDCEDCDDWKDPTTWEKANPLLGVSISERYLREQVQEAVQMPSKQNIVKRLNFCLWTEQNVRWMPMDAWDACDLAALGPRPWLRPDFALRGRPCYAGLDMASTVDLAALVLLFPPRTPEESFEILPFFWIPEDTVKLRLERDSMDYQPWIDAGWLHTTEGNVIDQAVIRAAISGAHIFEDVSPTQAQGMADWLTAHGYPSEGLGTLFSIQEIAIDPWNAGGMLTQLTGDGFAVLEYRQGFFSMNSPTKELFKLILSQGVNHGGNPILRWMASNVSVRTDPAGNEKPDKEKSSEKIDGIVALIMALGRAILRPVPKKSKYETEGLTTV